MQLLYLLLVQFIQKVSWKLRVAGLAVLCKKNYNLLQFGTKITLHEKSDDQSFAW